MEEAHVSTRVGSQLVISQISQPQMVSFVITELTALEPEQTISNTLVACW